MWRGWWWSWTCRVSISPQSWFPASYLLFYFLFIMRQGLTNLPNSGLEVTLKLRKVLNCEPPASASPVAEMTALWLLSQDITWLCLFKYNHPEKLSCWIGIHPVTWGRLPAARTPPWLLHRLLFLFSISFWFPAFTAAYSALRFRSRLSDTDSSVEFLPFWMAELSEKASLSLTLKVPFRNWFLCSWLHFLKKPQR